MKKEYLITLQGALAAVSAYLSNRLGILYPVFGILLLLMAADYITGMLASKAEALDHPGDPNYGWSSKKGAKGIIKKVGYMCIIAVAMVLDYIILAAADKLGFQAPSGAFFGLLVSVWYILNEMLSIAENAGRMGSDMPEWLNRYIAILKYKIDTTYEDPDKLDHL